MPQLEVVNGAPAKRATPPTFPLDVYPEQLQAYVTALAAAVENTPEVIGFCTLGALSATIGSHIQVERFGGYTTYCNGYYLLVAEVGSGKTPIFKNLTAPLDELEREVRAGAAVDAREYRAQRKQAEKKLQDLEKKPNSADFIDDHVTLEEELEMLRAKERIPVLLISDTSSEKLVKVQAENGGAISMVSGESPVFGNLSGRYGKKPAIEPYLSGFDGEEIRTSRITRDDDYVARARLAILGATQDAVLYSVKDRPELIDRGFIARHCFRLARPVLFDHPPRPVPFELREYYRRLTLDLGREYYAREIKPFVLGPGAAAAYDEWREGFKRRFKSETGDLYEIRDHGSKVTDLVLRWAGLLHALWCHVEGREPGTITVTDLNRALSLVEPDLRQFRAINAMIHGGPVVTVKRKLRAWAKRSRGQVVSYRDLRKKLASTYATEVFDEAIADLDELEYDEIKTAGRPRKIIRVAAEVLA